MIKLFSKFNLLRYIYFSLIFIFDLFVLIFTKNNHKTNIGIIRLDAIGDFTIWLSTAKYYKKFFPNNHIILIVNSNSYDLAKLFPFWDEIICIDINKFKFNFYYRFKIIKLIRNNGFKFLFNPTFSRNFLTDDSIIRSSQSPYKIGLSGDTANSSGFFKTISSIYYSSLFYSSNCLTDEFNRNFEFINFIFNINCDRLPSDLSFAVSKNNFIIDEPYIVIFPSASWSGRVWPIDHFADLISKISDYGNYKFVVCGGSSDFILCDELCNKTSVSCINLAGKTTLSELISIISNASLLITNETSAVHIGASLNILTICIAGGGHYGRFVPYPSNIKGLLPIIVSNQMPCFNCNWNCIYSFPMIAQCLAYHLYLLIMYLVF